MTRSAQLIILAAMFLLVGCGTDYYVDKMIMPSTQNGRMHQSMTGSGPSLVDSGKISEHRQATLTDGHTMDYWLIKASPEITAHTNNQAVATIVMVHDLGESKSRLLKLGRRLGELGYDVVLPDLRRHGRSTGDYFTYGAREKDDLRTLMDQLRREQAVSPKIVAFGEGVGASIAIIYASYDPNCMGIVAYQPYADLKSDMESQSAFSMLKEGPLEEVMEAGCLKADFEPAQASAALAAMQMRCPIRLIRRKGDMNYPAEETQRIYESSNGSKEMTIVAMGGEDWSFVTDPTDYLAEQINDFAIGGLVSGYYRNTVRERRDTEFMNIPTP
jgi:pimeloyl-ACP methyl ester carboxylesterase